MGDCVDISGGLVVDISGRMGGGQFWLDVYTCLILIHYATSQIKWICTAARAWLNPSFGLSTMVSETLWMWLWTEQSDRLLWSNEGSKDCQARIPMYIVQGVPLFLPPPYFRMCQNGENIELNRVHNTTCHTLSHQSSGVRAMPFCVWISSGLCNFRWWPVLNSVFFFCRFCHREIRGWQE